MSVMIFNHETGLAWVGPGPGLGGGWWWWWWVVVEQKMSVFAGNILTSQGWTEILSWVQATKNLFVHNRHTTAK